MIYNPSMLIFDALADPTRRQIIELLAQGEQTAGELADHFPISAPAVSQHLKVLRESTLVTVRVDAQRRIYALNPTALAAVDAWMTQVRGFWSARLDALATQLAAEERKEEREEPTNE